MDEQLLHYWNLQIALEDTVYHLGDIVFRSAKDPAHYLKRLNGKSRLLVGDHDWEMIKRHADFFDSIDPLFTIKIDQQRIALCHYAMRVWDASHRGSWHLYGHSHGKLTPHGASFDVGVDCHEFSRLVGRQCERGWKHCERTSSSAHA